METSSSEHSNQFQFFDPTLLFRSLICYQSIIKSFFSRYWSFPKFQQDEQDCCSRASNWEKENQKFIECSSKEEKKKKDEGRVYRKDVEKLMGNMGLFCSQESEELNESYGSDELSKLFEEEPSLDEVKQAFDVFDVNKDGFIDAEELQRVLCILGLKEGFHLDNCSKMIKNFDVDGDGRIDFHKFVKFMENSFC